jgi:hypothetical protein
MNTQESTIHYHAGYNMTGYLPEMEPGTFAEYADAKRYMIWELDRQGDFEFDSGTPEGKDIADSLSAEMEDLNLDNGPEWGAIVGNMSYWIMPCEDSDCVDDEGEDY